MYKRDSFCELGSLRAKIGPGIFMDVVINSPKIQKITIGAESGAEINMIYLTVFYRRGLTMKCNKQIINMSNIFVRLSTILRN